DVPHIPPHLPGMVTMKRVVNGYVDDLKTRLSDFTVIEKADDALDHNKAVWLIVSGRECAGEGEDQERKIAAFIAIRNEHVFILQADATPRCFDAAICALLTIAENWNWAK